MENFDIFVTGVAATVSAIVVFCGSIWLVLTMVLGARLAYFVTATITLAFLLMMGIVWSLPTPPGTTPLGPVGELPTWKPVDIAEQPSQLGFGPAAGYPEGPWESVDQEDEAQVTQGSELETAALEELEAAINEGKIQNFEEPADGAVDPDKTRLLEQDGDLYGIAVVTPTEDAVDAGTARGQVVMVAQYDFGNVTGPARSITVGFLALLGLHLYGLSRSERRAKELIGASGEARGA